MRILTDIPDDDIEQLDALASKRKSSRAAAIRDAVKLYLVHNADNQDWITRVPVSGSTKPILAMQSNISGRCARTADPMKRFDLCPIPFSTPTF